MSDKDKKKDQAEGGKNAKDNKQAPTLNDTLEKVFRDVALIDPKENVEGVIKEILRQVRAMKTELTAEEMAQLVLKTCSRALVIICWRGYSPTSLRSTAK